MVLMVAACGEAARVDEATPTSAGSTAVERVVPPATVAVTYTEDDPLVVLLIGDSVTYELAPAITQALESTGQVEVEELTQFGFALSLSHLNGWRTNWPAVVDTMQPDLVLIQTGIWDVDDNIQAAGRNPAPEDSDWSAAFGVLLDEATFVLAHREADVVWMSMLPGPDPAPSQLMNDQAQALADRNRFVSYLDIAKPLRSDTGGIVEIDDSDGAYLRKPDGVHLCVDGAARATAVVLAEVERRYGVTPADNWAEGSWRDDGRYDVNPCADRN